MNTPAKLGAFAVLLVLALLGGAALGAAVGPIDVEPAPDADHGGHDAAPAAPTAPRSEVGGLSLSADGYSLVVADRTLDGERIVLTITDPDGQPVTAYEPRHDRELHLVLVSRDLRHYAHVHPTRGDDGVWSVDRPELAPGSYRAFADFQPAGGDPLALGIDVTVPGLPPGTEPLVPADHDTVGGFEVALEPSGPAKVTLTVRRDGEVVTTEPYLGAAGHLVAIRDGDLGYLHVHPLDDEPAGPVRFAVTYPSAGTYALFFDFKVDGVVHTASFIVEAPATDMEGHDAH